MLVALQGWEGDGERNGDMDASILDKQENDQEKRSRLCNWIAWASKMQESLQEGREGAAGSRKNVP